MYEYRKLTLEERVQLVNERLAKGYPAHSPPHPVRDFEFYHLTVSCFEHKSRINTQERRHQLLDSIFEKFISDGIEINAWVVLPLSVLFRSIHGPLARQWNLEDRVTGKVWCSFSDRAIRSERHYYTTINYINYNPVKHGWAKSPYDWSASSVHWYLEYQGREWLRSAWTEYPVRDYGKGWDD
ncbi:transposase [Microcoleus sp. PH2017_18_LLB_O_A]|uniref:transposase n=1 Tax=Microcoleus sp. PH2017_18_LLB_O_A TaxID=2798829 RepID=UPI001D70C825|nr:transposase [Microcoleus sp. PH2017_18_LLB_O_A]MCC3516387.1 transposase [Microcoleus sp. PH2017_18_LLB_O_A]